MNFFSKFEDMKLQIIISIFFLGSCLTSFSQKSTYIKQVASKSVDSLFSTLPIYQLIDVRSEKEYSEKHVKGALNQDVLQKKFVKHFKKAFPSKDITYVVYCRTGKRSMTAAEQLTKAGYKIVNITEGITQISPEHLWINPSIKIQNFQDSTKSTVNQ